MRSLGEAFRFLTAIPLPKRDCEEAALAASISWFTLIGAVLGALLLLVDLGVGDAFPQPGALLISAAAVLAAYALLTGGLHHDGLMDTADALWGKRSGGRERRLAILKDSHAGALGASALMLLLLLEFAAIAILPEGLEGGEMRRASLFAFPVVGRWVMAYLCLRFPYARPEGTAAAMVGLSKPIFLIPATLIAGGALAASFVWIVDVPWMILVLAAVALVFAEGWGRFCRHALGGVTGDVIGAGGMLAEMLVLLLLASRLPELLVK
jgi:adenosylcobinamide-GDP ribazoletransferase